MQIAKSRRTLRINLGAAGEGTQRGSRNRKVENLEMPGDSCGTHRLIYLTPPHPSPRTLQLFLETVPSFACEKEKSASLGNRFFF